MPKFAAGVVKFQREVFPEQRALFEKLATGQSPEALMITCSDSRIDPNMLTQTQPGELFICRNAGNIVPPHSTYTGAMTAAIEFAVGALNVPHIVVCGHSNCGAMKGALNLDALGELPHVAEWLDHCRGAIQIARKKSAGLDQDQLLKLATEENVIQQLAHIRTHPYVAQALAMGELTLHGWVYDIATGGVSAFDEATRSFVPVDQRYAEAIADIMPDHEHGAGCSAAG